MIKNILITGSPRSGKSTLVRQLLGGIPHKVGFLTDEILVEDKRVGFAVETSKGDKAVLAHIDAISSHHVGRYAVNPERLDFLLSQLPQPNPDDLVYIDEIGPMELLSESFKAFVTKSLNAPNTCLATIVAASDDAFVQQIKDRTNVIIIEITPDNRDTQAVFVQQLINKIAKARQYLAEPARFTQRGSTVELQSNHGLRTLSPVGDTWRCDCDFYAEYKICSHVIAAQELLTSKTAINKQKNS